MFSTKTNQLSTLFLTLALGVPATRQSAEAQTTARVGARNVATPAEERRALSEDRIARMATAAHVGLTVIEERGPAFGSGVLIKPSARMERFLRPDEVLVLSVSHNFADFGSQSQVYGTFFVPEIRSGLGRNLAREDCRGRVIGRFIPEGGNKGILFSSLSNVDVAFLAIRVPINEAEAVRERALPLGKPGDASIQIGTRAYSTGSRGSEPDPSGKGMRVAKPNFRKGIILNPTSPPGGPAPLTQFGNIPDDVVLTTIECLPGDSGGALVAVNSASGELEVVGVCSAGGEVDKSEYGWIDFPVDKLGIPEAEMQRYGLVEAVSRKIPEAKSPYRGFFTGLKAVEALEEALSSRYAELERDLSDLDRVYAEVKSGFASPSREQTNFSGLKTLHQTARKRLVEELEHFKPTR